MWNYQGQKRPAFADQTRPGQESVWDYPRPPAVRPDSRQVSVKLGAIVIASSNSTVRVCETASPPTFYIDPEHIDWHFLESAGGESWCEWKGVARYWRLSSQPALGAVAWAYPDPTPEFDSLRGWVSFYPGKVECLVDQERVKPQPGSFYGGWVTEDVSGPFKGEPGTGHW